MTREDVETAVQELQTAGTAPTYAAVLAKIGGSRRDLRQLLPLVLGESTPVPPPTLREQYAQDVQTHQTTRHRVQELTAKVQAQGLLADDEESELLRLKMRLEHLEAHLAHLKHQVDTEQQRVDIAAVVEAMAATREHKAAYYDAIVQGVQYLAGCVAGLRQVHAEQEAILGTLPRALQERLMFPDGQTIVARLAQQMPIPQGWHMVLCSSPFVAVPPGGAALGANDPGLKPLPPRILAPFQHPAEDV